MQNNCAILSKGLQITDFSVNQDPDKMIFNTNISINTRGGKQNFPIPKLHF